MINSLQNQLNEFIELRLFISPFFIIQIVKREKNTEKKTK